MPWHTQREGGKYVVKNKSTGRVMGTHSSKAKADRQVNVLYAYVPESRKK